MQWNWFLLDDGTLEIYYKGVLYWELEGFKNYSEKEINLFAKEYIMKNQFRLREDI